MREQVAEVITSLRPRLQAQNCDVELLEVTKLGVVTVALSGDCCFGRLQRLLTIIDIENLLKQKVPEVKVVIEKE